MLKRTGRDRCWFFTLQGSEEASHIDVSLKTMFPPVYWSRHDGSFCRFITAEKKIRTKWKVRNGVMLNLDFLKCLICS